MITFNNSCCKYYRPNFYSHSGTDVLLGHLRCHTYTIRPYLTWFNWYRVFLGTGVEDGSRPCYICCEFIKNSYLSTSILSRSSVSGWMFFKMDSVVRKMEFRRVVFDLNNPSIT